METTKKELNQENTALKSLFWSDEILQIMFWMKGEYLGESVGVKDLLTLLNTDPDNLMFHLKKLVEQEYLVCDSNSFSIESKLRLSEYGIKKAGRNFAEAFQGLQKVGHGECGPDCDCQFEGHDTCEQHHHNH